MTLTQMITALQDKLGHATLQKRISEERMDPDTGYIRMSVAKAIYNIYAQEIT